MRENRFIQEISLAIILIVLSIALLEPFGLFMAPMVLTSGAVVLFIGIVLFSALIWREKALDEREESLRMRTDRVAFLTGVLALSAVIVIQAFNHALDSMLILALVAMVSAKIVARAFYQTKG